MRFLFYVVVVFVFGSAHAQTTITGSFMHDGINRTYSFYVPASYVAGNAVPLVIGLHGTGSDGESFIQNRDFRPIADTAGFIVAYPDGSTLLGIKFWNYGNVLGSDVDDVGFLEALIDTIAAAYTINPQRVYCTGMSNGSFMAYCLACDSDRFAAIGTVTGSMSVDMYNSCNPAYPVPSIHIHGTDDDVNPYDGTSTMVGIDQMNSFWVNENSCDVIPIVTPVPDINTTDDATATRYLYPGGMNGNTVELFKITGGEHTWPGWPMPGSSDITCMDFDGCKEIWRFFNQYERPVNASLDDQPEVELNIAPNPSTGIVFIQSAEKIITQVSVYDMQGRLVHTITQETIEHINVDQLLPGNYLIQISGDDFSATKKLVISTH